MKKSLALIFIVTFAITALTGCGNSGAFEEATTWTSKAATDFQRVLSATEKGASSRDPDVMRLAFADANQAARDAQADAAAATAARARANPDEFARIDALLNDANANAAKASDAAKRLAPSSARFIKIVVVDPALADKSNKWITSIGNYLGTRLEETAKEQVQQVVKDAYCYVRSRHLTHPGVPITTDEIRTFVVDRLKAVGYSLANIPDEALQLYEFGMLYNEVQTQSGVTPENLQELYSLLCG